MFELTTHVKESDKIYCIKDDNNILYCQNRVVISLTVFTVGRELAAWLHFYDQLRRNSGVSDINNIISQSLDEYF